MAAQAEVQVIDVLVVEDDPGDRRLIKLLLARSSGTPRFNVTSAATVQEAIACLSNSGYGVILLDLGLPDSNGLNTIRTIHNISPNLPIVVLTGLNDEDLGLEAIKWGAQDYLIKGSSLDYLLIRAIRYAIERKRAAEEWEHTFNSMTDAIFIVDNESNIVKANDAFHRTFGERMPDGMIEICHGARQWEDGARLTAPAVGAPRSVTTEIHDPVLNVPFLVTASPLHDEMGCATGVVYVAKDVTEIKRAEQQMREAVEVKSQFISMASHELRTPLTAIKESIDIVSEGAAAVLSAEMQEFLRLAKRNIDRLSRLINDVLDIQKLESGRVEFHIQESDINQVIREVSASMMPTARQKGLDFRLSLMGDPPPIRFDRDKITQVLVNLMNNAIKFTDTGAITVATAREGKAIVTTIADTGPGIRSEDLPRLFQKFQQLGGPNQRKTGGTGLGLAICKQIIEEHAGKIWADSKPGVGTQLKFLLPFEQAWMRDDEEDAPADVGPAHVSQDVEMTHDEG